MFNLKILTLSILLLSIIIFYIRKEKVGKDSEFFIEIQNHNISFQRTEDGVVIIKGKETFDFSRGLGYIHATDRLVQMTLQKLVGHGKLSSLSTSPESIAIDRLMLEMSFSRSAKKTFDKLDETSKKYLEAYTEGVNHAMRNRNPLEFTIASYEKTNWTPVDSLVTIIMSGFVGLR
jgi:penicillin G amidase